MFSKIWTKKFTSDCSEQTDKLNTVLKEADAVIIGAGAGLSTAAGFTYSGERFEKYFKDFREKYGFEDMYSGGFYPYETLEEYWAFWSRYIYVNRYMDAPEPVYDDLFKLVCDKDYFVITTNVDHCFQKAGFDKKRLFYTQGDYGLFQCMKPCCQETLDNETVIRQMVLSQGYEIEENGSLKQQSEHLSEHPVKMKVPSDLVPHCPHCGRPMTMNLRCDNTFVQDNGWYQAADRYEDFLRRHKGLKVVFLELGVGNNTPGIIKYPFWQMTAHNPNSTYICINAGQAYALREIEHQSICMNADIKAILNKIKQ